MGLKLAVELFTSLTDVDTDAIPFVTGIEIALVVAVLVFRNFVGLVTVSFVFIVDTVIDFDDVEGLTFVLFAFASLASPVAADFVVCFDIRFLEICTSVAVTDVDVVIAVFCVKVEFLLNCVVAAVDLAT